MNVWACFKDEHIRQRSLRLHPLCYMILGDMIFWAKSHNLPFVVTETVTTEAEDIELKRVSKTHREARAFDVSLRGWDETGIKTFMLHFADKYNHLSALSRDGSHRLIVRHDAGTGDHLHVQINSQFKGGFENE